MDIIPQEAATPLTNVQLAQQILLWIRRYQQEIREQSKTDIALRRSLLITEIETLCKEQLAGKEPTMSEEEQQPTRIPGLSEGRIVHYVLSNGQHRPAIVVRNWSNQDIPGSDGMVNLTVFADGSNDAGVIGGSASVQGLFWATSVHYDPEGNKHHTWHWPEKA